MQIYAISGNKYSACEDAKMPPFKKDIPIPRKVPELIAQLELARYSPDKSKAAAIIKQIKDLLIGLPNGKKLFNDIVANT